MAALQQIIFNVDSAILERMIRDQGRTTQVSLSSQELASLLYTHVLFWMERGRFRCSLLSPSRRTEQRAFRSSGEIRVGGPCQSAGEKPWISRRIMDMTPGDGARSQIFSAIKVTLIPRGVPSAGGSPRTKNRAERSSNVYRELRSAGFTRHKKSEMSSYQIALGSRPGKNCSQDSSGKARDFKKGLFLVSSVFALANEASAKDFSLGDGDSWCAFAS